ncbi:pilus assembly protein [soil metagenome]
MMRRLSAPLVAGRRNRDGSSAIEFAMVAFPFFFMMFAIIEIGMIFVTDSILENATIETGRMIRTGEVAGSSMSASQFKTQLCNRMSIFASQCPSRATIDVRVINQFRNQNPPDPMASGTSFDSTQLGYQPGQPGSLILIRVFYKQPLFTPFLAQALSKLGDGNTIMTATTTFRNEPYDQ